MEGYMGIFDKIKEIQQKKEENDRLKKERDTVIIEEQKERERAIKTQIQKDIIIKHSIPGYCELLNQKTIDFKNELKGLGIIPLIGFEIEKLRSITYGGDGVLRDGSMIFDVKSLKGLAFDTSTKKMIVFSFNGNLIESYAIENHEKIYNYSIIDFNEIFNVKVEVDSITTYQSSIPNKNMITRTLVGGALLGDAGAIIGGTTAQRVTNVNTSPKKVSLIIQTTNLDVPIISFEVRKKLIKDGEIGDAEYSIIDTTLSIFSDMDKLFIFDKININRRNGSNEDIIINRAKKNIINNNDEDEFKKTKSYYITSVKERFDFYAMQIETIIKQCDVDRNKKYPENQESDKQSIVEELKKLAELKESCVLTEEEFLVLKTKLIKEV
jgi:hypothetical protein